MITWRGRRLAANCSMLYASVPVLDRPQAARDAGFDAVEFWWPFTGAVASTAQIARFAGALDAAQVRLVAVNAYGGDLAAGERGIAAHPHREAEYATSVTSALAVAAATGCRVVHVLYGNRLPGVPAHAQEELAARNLRAAADAAARVGVTIVVEPLSSVAGYPLRTARDVLRVLDAVDRPNVKLLADVYHLAANGDDPLQVLGDHLERIGHVQFADHPGRGRPGTGTLPFAEYLDLLTAAGYRGEIGLEYLPGVTADREPTAPARRTRS